MVIAQRIISEIYDKEDGSVLKRVIIKDKDVIDPKSIDDVGYNQAEQVSILQNTQDEYLQYMSKVMANIMCPKCGNETRGISQLICDFHSVYTDHKIPISRRQCKRCKEKFNRTIHSLFGSTLHPDLVKKQTEVGSQMSYSNASASMARESGKIRSINNQYTIQKTVDKVGIILNDLHQKLIPDKIPDPAEHLVVQVDRGYIKDKDPKKKSFEVLVGKISNPKDHKKGYIKENGNRVSGVIENKIYVANALKDRHSTMKMMTVTAAMKQGLTKETKITAISDGAENCWNIIKSLRKFCKSMESILDWFHIKQKFENLLNLVDDPAYKKLNSIQWNIWHGQKEEGLDKLQDLYTLSIKEDYVDKIHELLKYLTLNKEYLINYNERKKNKLPYTSSIIESSVECIINERHKKKQKAQWSRQGAHNVLQIRTSIASNRWDKEWEHAKNGLYKLAA